MTATHFQISIPDEELHQLKAKLELATFPDELDHAGWTHGSPLSDVKRLVTHWRDNFDWRMAEAKLNELPQFRTRVPVEGFGELDIHFVHQRNDIDGAIPLLFCHGWPGSFVEVAKILPLLKGGDKAPAFHIVAPSLPNFGFSEGVKKKGFSLPKYAETLHNLMLQLGYDKYVTQGGDWGWGYRIIQSIKPQTIGYNLADSPTGLLAWIYEKLHDWTDAYPWDADEICTWVSIYWFSTAGPAASVRIYYESRHEDGVDGKMDSIIRVGRWIPHSKVGLMYCPKELDPASRTLGRTLGPVVHEKELEHGGHFAAWEKPQEVAGALIEMFGKGGPCYGLIKGNNGYATRASL